MFDEHLNNFEVQEELMEHDFCNLMAKPVCDTTYFEFYIRLSKHVNRETFRIEECFKNNPPKDLAGIA
jgi:hypothetical protein